MMRTTGIAVDGGATVPSWRIELDRGHQNQHAARYFQTRIWRNGPVNGRLRETRHFFGYCEKRRKKTT